MPVEGAHARRIGPECRVDHATMASNRSPYPSRRRCGHGWKRPGEVPEAGRLEGIWAGDFGDAYSSSGTPTPGLDGTRSGIRWSRSTRSSASSRSAATRAPTCDGSRPTLRRGTRTASTSTRRRWPSLRERFPASARSSPRRSELPFRDRWFDLASPRACLIHQPESTLPLVMAEIVRVSRRYVLCGEYFAPETGRGPIPRGAGARSSSATTAGSTASCSRSSA